LSLYLVNKLEGLSTAHIFFIQWLHITNHTSVLTLTTCSTRRRRMRRKFVKNDMFKMER